MNRILGIVFTIAAIAVMVFAVLNWGNYTSLCFTKSEPAEEDIEIFEALIPADSVEMEGIEIVEDTTPIEPADSLNN